MMFYESAISIARNQIGYSKIVRLIPHFMFNPLNVIAS